MDEFLKVGEELISKFNYVAGSIPIIKTYINEVLGWQIKQLQ